MSFIVSEDCLKLGLPRPIPPTAGPLALACGLHSSSGVVGSR